MVWYCFRFLFWTLNEIVRDDCQMMIAEIHLPEIHQMKPWMEIDSYSIRRNTFPSISGDGTRLNLLKCGVFNVVIPNRKLDMDGFKRRLMVCGAQQLAKYF